MCPRTATVVLDTPRIGARLARPVDQFIGRVRAAPLALALSERVHDSQRRHMVPTYTLTASNQVISAIPAYAGGLSITAVPVCLTTTTSRPGPRPVVGKAEGKDAGWLVNFPGQTSR